MPPRRLRTTAALLVLAALAGCGQVAATDPEDVVAQAPSDGTPPAKPYAGRLDGKNAAAKALECEGKVFRGNAGLPAYEEIDGASTPEGAVANWDKDAFPFDHPIAKDGYELAVRKGDRALLTYTYEGRVRSAAIAVDDKGPKTWLEGWGVLDAAWCDPSEFPAELEGNHWTQVWTDRDGNRVDTRTLHSSPGAAHCDWQSATFLFVNDAKRWYIRDPEGVILTRLLRGPYRPQAKMPKGVKDTGYRRDGMALYLTDDAAYVRYADRVEAWPRATDGWGCV